MNILKSMWIRLIGLFQWFQNASLKRKLLVVTVAAIVLFVIFRSTSGGSQQQIQTDTVKRGTITETVSESGNIQSNQVTVYSTSNGVIQEVYVDNGNTVDAGDNLFKIKATATEEEKATAWANYQSVVSAQKTAEQTKLTNDATMWTKQKTLLDAREAKRVKDENKDDYEDLEEQSIDAAMIQSEKDFTATEQKYKESDVSITSAKALVNSTWIKYQATQDSIVKAPIGGTIANLAYGAGDKVSAQSAGGANASTTTTSTASPVLVIGTETEYAIKIPLTEGDINKIKVGQDATIDIAAIKEKKFEGNVIRVDEYGTDTSGVITYNVYVKINNPDPAIKPSMSATVTIEAARHENTLVVPNSAVKPYKGGKAVQIVDSNARGQYKYVEVKTGLKSSTETEIIGGVSEGQQVITSAAVSVPAQGGGGFRLMGR